MTCPPNGDVAKIWKRSDGLESELRFATTTQIGPPSWLTSSTSTLYVRPQEEDSPPQSGQRSLSKSIFDMLKKKVSLKKVVFAN